MRFYALCRINLTDILCSTITTILFAPLTLEWNELLVSPYVFRSSHNSSNTVNQTIWAILLHSSTPTSLTPKLSHSKTNRRSPTRNLILAVPLWLNQRHDTKNRYHSTHHVCPSVDWVYHLDFAFVSTPSINCCFDITHIWQYTYNIL